MERTRVLGVLAGLLVAGLLVAACAEPDGDDGGAGQGLATTVPTTQPGGTPSTRPVPPGGQVTVVGMVADGVEPGCLVLDAEGGGSYLLVGGDRAALRSGTRLAVTGRVDRNLASTCQQGMPLVVASVEPAP
jgi:hypothetical protein